MLTSVGDDGRTSCINQSSYLSLPNHCAYVHNDGSCFMCLHSAAQTDQRRAIDRTSHVGTGWYINSLIERRQVIGSLQKWRHVCEIINLVRGIYCPLHSLWSFEYCPDPVRDPPLPFVAFRGKESENWRQFSWLELSTPNLRF